MHKVLGAIVNTGRSFPFIILLVVLTALTRAIVGTSIGSTAALVPLTLAAIPFFARIAETSILEVDKGLIEAAQAMGCNHWQIVLKVLIPSQVTSNTAQATAQKEVIQVGVTGIISEDILKFVNTKLAPQEGLKVKVVTFNDWIQPNIALRDKVIDANFYQHRPFMNNAVKELKINLVPLNLVSLSTLGLFSKSLKSVNEVPQNATVTIANDVINNDRGLRLLASNGLIKLKENTKEFVTQRDIAENPKNLRIKEVEGVQVVRAINDVDFIVSSAQIVALAGITPQSMGQETAKDTKYALALVTLQGRENEPKIQKLNKLLHDPQVRDFINKQYQGQIVPVF